MSGRLTKYRVAGATPDGGSIVRIDDPNAFLNINSPGDLDAWLAGGFHAGI